GNMMILPPISVEEQIAIQRETKARTILLQSLPEDHMADFHQLDDARDIWLAVKARFGGNDESKKIRKSMLKQEFSEFRVAITLKTKGGLDYLSFDDLYNKLRTLEIDVKGGSSYDSRDDARNIWLAVKARFGGNDESKKMRKSMLKQEFSEFRVSESEGLHKGYDMFQKILSQLNQMQAKPDNEDCYMKFLRALPPSWSQVAITLKTKGGLDYLSFDDL
ncbi:hypothetical protein Tco_0194630, partial [Tanacetum coccineum]